MNGLQIYLLGCFIAYPIAIHFLKMYSRVSKEKNLFIDFQQKLEQIMPTISKNFFKNWFIVFMVVLSWAIVVAWSYLKIKLLYYTIKYYLFRK
jgi:hypothetical protein